MDYAFSMRDLQAIEDLDRDVDQAVQFQWCTEDHVLDCHSVKELHGNEGAAVELPDVVNSADVGMVQSRSGSRLALEALARLKMVAEVVGQEL